MSVPKSAELKERAERVSRILATISTPLSEARRLRLPAPYVTPSTHPFPNHKQQTLASTNAAASEVSTRPNAKLFPTFSP
jgi:hypothetical protein